MAKKKYQHKQYPKNSSKDKFIFTRNTIIVISIITALVSAIAYFGVKSMIPVNSNTPVLSAPKNNFVKASHHPQSGYLFVGQSAGGTRKNFSPTTGVGIGNANAGNKSFADSPTGPTLYITKGGLESIHFINEDYDTHSKHNFNIDEFKVHSKDLGYFQSQIITFIVDKDGMFEYFCTIHPEMRGKVVVVGLEDDYKSKNGHNNHDKWDVAIIAAEKYILWCSIDSQENYYLMKRTDG